jgi:hypothetical protein
MLQSPSILGQGAGPAPSLAPGYRVISLPQNHLPPVQQQVPLLH